MTAPVGAPVSDTTPPVRTNGQPTGTLPAGTTQTTLSLTTNENATCRYATTAGVAYSAMPTTFTTTGGTTHSTPFRGLTNGGSYNRLRPLPGYGQSAQRQSERLRHHLHRRRTMRRRHGSASRRDHVAVRHGDCFRNDRHHRGRLGQRRRGGRTVPDRWSNFGRRTQSRRTHLVGYHCGAGGPHTLSARARMLLETPGTSVAINVNVANNPVPGGFYDEVVIGSGVTFPTSFEFLPDGRMLIAEFRGRGDDRSTRRLDTRRNAGSRADEHFRRGRDRRRRAWARQHRGRTRIFPPTAISICSTPPPRRSETACPVSR